MTVQLVVAAIATLAVAVVLIRTLLCPRAAPALPPIGDQALGRAAGSEEALSALIKIPTVSSYDAASEDAAAFAAFASEMERLYPAVHAKMDRELLGDRALLYKWKGSDHRSLPPVILCAHYDVVPAADAQEWERPPFSGQIVDGEVWGRGAQDVKVIIAAALGAAERLLAEGFKPKRTIYFAFGGDEEVGGTRGARLIAERLASKGVQAAFLLDEGAPIADGMLSFADRPLALVGIAEKGYIDMSIETAGAGGHASMPPRRTAAGDLARAIAAIEASRTGSRLTYTLRNFLGRLSPYSSFAMRAIFRNL
ncbi:MAG: M20/M25/M40 family metallo-hydrolase, partial [Spirochaetaceae bacterium]|nr:M20/M25/M40 family metallo-hydrolase [Spirochaetaceae bacterium]